MGTDMPRPRGGNGLDEGRLAASVLADEQVKPGAGSKPLSTSSRTAGIVKGHLSIRTLPRSTSIRRRGAPVSVLIGRIFSGPGW
jgi:hypothetical protein